MKSILDCFRNFHARNKPIKLFFFTAKHQRTTPSPRSSEASRYLQKCRKGKVNQHLRYRLRRAPHLAEYQIIKVRKSSSLGIGRDREEKSSKQAGREGRRWWRRWTNEVGVKYRSQQVGTTHHPHLPSALPLFFPSALKPGTEPSPIQVMSKALASRVVHCRKKRRNMHGVIPASISACVISRARNSVTSRTMRAQAFYRSYFSCVVMGADALGQLGIGTSFLT